MKDRVSNDIGTKEPLQTWASLNWKSIKKRVRNLRQRIYRATENGQWNQVRSLMKLMLRSYSNLLLAVRRITQENPGKQTAGLDGQTVLNPKERVDLVREMKHYSVWQVRPTKRVYIPKSNGKKRPLGIATIKDRVAQTIVKNALEPSWEARFEANSYGFRVGRSCHDALEQCHLRLQKGRDTWVLDADIKGAFDNISHEFILNTIGLIPGRELIKQWLKAGYIEAEVFHETQSGTPQGGTISPLLANIALDGIERLLASYKKVKVYQYTPKGRKKTRTVEKPSDRYGFIRYADDFVVTAETKQDIEEIIPTLENWLLKRGLELNPDKTNVVHIEQGFDFLGFNIRQFKGKCLQVPQKLKTRELLKQVRMWLKTHPTVKPEAVISHLNPILRGWANYNRHGVSKRVFSYIDSEIWKALWKWALKRHPKKRKRWVANKYFKTINGASWQFATTITNRHAKVQTVHVFKMASVPIERHVKVKGRSSPDNPKLSSYWEHRNTQYGKTYWAKGSKHLLVAKNQNWFCPVCGEHLFNGEELHTHHIIQVKDGGTDFVDNFVHLHKACHKHLHTGKRSKLLEA